MPAKVAANGGGNVNFARVLKEVLWCLVTEGSISYRRIKRGFDLDDDALEDVRREMISTLRIAADIDGELLVWALMGARPDPSQWRCRNHCRPCGTLRDRLPRPWWPYHRTPSGAS